MAERERSSPCMGRSIGVRVPGTRRIEETAWTGGKFERDLMSESRKVTERIRGDRGALWLGPAQSVNVDGEAT